MRYRERLFIALTCTALAGLFCAGSLCAEVIDRTVATVNGEIILYSEVLAQVELMEKTFPELKNLPPEKKPQLERDALTQLIQQKLTEQEIKRLKIIVPSAEVETTISGIKKENNLTDSQFEYLLKQDGLTLEKFRENIKKELERNRLLDRVLKSKTVITDAQVDAYLKEGPKEGSKTAALSQQRLRLGIIFLPVADRKDDAKAVEKTGREILEKLKNGADFGKMAIQYSKGPAAGEGGDIGFMSSEDLAPYIADAVRTLRKNQVSTLVQGQGGYYIFKVLDIQAQQAVAKSGSDLRERARKELFQQELNRKFEEWVRTLESKAFIQITL
jgi:peptidyl-prolyl cis-trans isomerase SurA